MKIKKLQGLFAKAVIVLFIISIVPVLIIGYRIMKINSRLLKNELLQKQQMVAERLASTVNSALVAKEQLLSEFGDLHTDFGSHDLITEPDLAYLQQRTPSLFYLAIFSPSGKTAFDEGVAPTQSLASIKEKLMQTCLGGTRFISEVYHDAQGNPFIWLGEPLHRKLSESKVTAVLATAMYLDDIIKSLLQAYPLDMDAFLVSAQGELLSYNGAPEGLDEAHSAPLLQKLYALESQLAGQDTAEVKFEGEELLVSVAGIRQTGWRIYLFQPANVASRLFVDSLFHSSLWDLIVVIAVMVLFVGIVSYLVIIPITRPLAKLRAAAVQLREDENFVVQRSDVEIPHNEIGDLAEVFVDMSQTLHHRQQELMHTQSELAGMNQILEKRVEERTKELKETTQELVKAERLAAIGQMASIISHEIRNPLAVISNATRLIKTLVKPTDQKLAKQFSIIEAEIRQANSIISEVLGYARTRDMIFSTIEVNSYLRELMLSLTVPPSIVVEEKLDSESVRIKVDAEEIKQALRNIISNAIEAMPTGGTLTIGTQLGRRLVCIYVKDTGVGLTPQVRQEMFSPFFTTKARGTGLGLAVVRKAITRHKGKLFIKSEVGKGTCFRVYLKIYRKTGDTNYGEAS